MNIKEIISNVTPEQLEKIGDFMGKIVPLIENRLPMLDAYEKTWREQYNVNPNDMFFYTAIKTPNNKKILIYVFTGYAAPNEVKFNNGRIIKTNDVIISGEINSFDLLEFLKEHTSDGINGLMNLLL